MKKILLILFSIFLHIYCLQTAWSLCQETAYDDPVVEIIRTWNPYSSPQGESITIRVLGYPNDPTRNVDLSGWILDDNNQPAVNVGNEPGHIKLGSCFTDVPPGTVITFSNDGGVSAGGFPCNEILYCEDIPNHQDGSYSGGSYTTSGLWKDHIPMRNWGDAVLLINASGRLADMVSWNYWVGGSTINFPSDYPNWGNGEPQQANNKECPNCDYIGDDQDLCENACVVWEPKALVIQLKREGKFIDSPTQDHPNASQLRPYVCLEETARLTRTIIDLGCGVGNDGNISVQDVYDIPVEDNLKVTIEGKTFVCSQDEMITLTAKVTGGNVSSYQWSNGATSERIQVIGPGTYGVIVTGAYGKTVQASINVELSAAGRAKIIPANSSAICDSKPLTLDINLSLEELSGVKWLFNGTQISSIQDIIIEKPGEYSLEVTDKNNCTSLQVIQIGLDESPLVQVSSSNSSICSGGTVTLTAQSNDEGYTYWSSGESGNSIIATESGTYSVTVVNNNGCEGTASKTINVSSGVAPTIEIVKSSDALCAGRPVELSVNVLSGSVSSYRWSNGSNTSSIKITDAGSYSVTVSSSNGCETSNSVRINEFSTEVEVIPSLIFLTSGEDQKAFAGPANDAYQYKWSNAPLENGYTINVSEIGSHSVTITADNGCSGIAKFDVSRMTANLIEICKGECVEIGIMPSVGYTYRWDAKETENTSSSKITVCPEGVKQYSLWVRDDKNFLIEVVNYTIQVKFSEFEITPNPAIICQDGTVTLSVPVVSEQNPVWSNGSIGYSTTVNSIGSYSVKLNDNCLVERDIEVIRSTDCNKLGEWFIDNGFWSTDVQSYRIIGIANSQDSKYNPNKASNEFIINDYTQIIVTVEGIEFDLYQDAFDAFSGTNTEVFITSSDNVCNSTNFSESIFNQVNEKFKNSSREQVIWRHVCFNDDGTATLFEKIA